MKKREYHGHAHKGKISGEYRVWTHIIGRCHNKTDGRYRDYGGRGITVCARWRKSFATFLRDVGLRPSTLHSIDRIKNDKGYKPGNVKWSTPAEQARNQRSNVLVTLNGVTLPLVDAAARAGLKYNTIVFRLLRGWSPERALTTPIRPMRDPHKLTEREKDQVRKLYATGKYTQAQLAQQFNTAGQSQISVIVRSGKRRKR